MPGGWCGEAGLMALASLHGYDVTGDVLSLRLQGRSAAGTCAPDTGQVAR